jgi:HlyD family secretion protein
MAARGIKVGGGVLMALLVGLGASHWIRDQGSAHQNSSTAAPTLVRVHVVAPESTGGEFTVTRPGTVHFFQYARLFSKVSGYLRNQTVDIGALVKKGQQLAEIYAPEIGADLRKAEADLTKAKAHVDVTQALLEESRANRQQAGNKLDQAQADVESARAMETLRKEQYTRIKHLADLKSVEAELVDEKNAARLAAEAATRSAVKAVATAKAGITAADANVARAAAKVDDAKAQVSVVRAVLDRARTMQDYTLIGSPYTGIITQRGYHEGDFIRDAASGTQGPVLTVGQTDLMRVVVWVPDPAVPFTRPGLPATFHVDALPDHPFSGKVARTAGSEDSGSRTMRTEIDLPNPDGLLKDGMYGSVIIHLGKRPGLMIPSAALTGAGAEDKRSVYVVKGGRAHEVSVRVGADDGVRAEVLGGLDAKDQVVLQHSPGLGDGVAVDVVTAPPEAGQGK